VSEHGVTIPKCELVSRFQMLMQGGHIQIAPALPDGTILIREIQNFKYNISHNEHDTYNAREGEHDDHVLATALTT
jgi:hypothetical protein